jgi:hypothetical protein
MPTTYKILGTQSVPGTTPTYAAVSNKVITSNVATITTAAVHGFAVGDIVVISGVDTTHDGVRAIATVPTTTTFTYLSTTATQTTAAVTPNATVMRTHNLAGVASANKYSTGVNAILTTGSAHGFAADDWVRVTVGDANMDGLVKVISAPSSTLFTYAISGSAVASTAVTTGVAARAIPSAWTTLYTVPSSTAAVISTIAVCNQTTSAAQYRIAFSATTTPTLAETYVFDATVPANDTVNLTIGATLPAAQKIMVNANSPEISFVAFGSEIS